MKPLLSIGIIFKNEIRCLERCLRALQPLRDAIPCEVVMADTGSDDGSRQVAEQFADQVFDFPWIDDFAAARNAVMDRCTGKWYLSLDADEVLDPNITELVAFLHSDAADQAQVSYLTIHNYTDANDLTKFIPFQALRLVNMATGARFTGKIHEKIGMEKGCAVCNLKATLLWHDGYLQQKGQQHGKKRRNLPMIQKELEENPGDTILLMEALESSYTKEQAAEYAGRIMDAIHGGTNTHPVLEPILMRDAVKFACMFELPQYQAWIKEAVERFPESPYIRVDVCYYAASMALRANDWRGMEQYSDVYLSEVREYLRNPAEYPLNMGALMTSTSDCIETIDLIRARAMAHAERWDPCREVLLNRPLAKVEMENVMLWFSLTFNHLGHMDMTEVFRQVGEDFFRGQELEKQQKEKMKIFHHTCCQMFLKGREDAPFELLEALGDCDLSRWAAVMTAGDQASLQAAADRIDDWKPVPEMVRDRLTAAGITVPAAE